MLELAFDLKQQQKADGSLLYGKYGEEDDLIWRQVVRVYDINTGKGPILFYVKEAKQEGGTLFTYKLMPLPTVIIE